jgi:transglutaminase-like putative cysteine protease
MGDQPAVPYLLGAFAVAGGVWLVLNHRADGPGDGATAAGTEVGRSALRLPYREAAVFGLLAAAAAGVALAGPKRVVLALGELVPTSGGTGDTDPFARYGVGDGPEETAGENARAAGMVETDRMIEDNKDALIDAVNDMYGPPHKPRKDQERMVAAGQVEVIQNHAKLPDNRRPSRELDTARTGPKRDGLKPESTAARGLFEVEGRTPLHVRVVAYDAYDPAAGRWREARRPVGVGLEPEGGDWMRVGTVRDAGWYSADDRHRLKAADLRDNLVPTPTLLTRLRINKVDRPDFYERDYDGVLALAGRRRTPPGVIATTDCRTLDPAALPATACAPAHPVFSEVPADLRPLLEQTASEWAGDRPRGWPQVEAVAERLRSGFALDRDTAAPAGHPHPVGWFLTESRRGPDYLFATSAALLLRSLGFPARVCLGYYAAPAAFDPETAHTPVRRTDLHVWPEVLLADGHWVVVEPTPGYEVLPPLRPWRERLADAALAVARWVGRHPLPLVTGVVVGFGVWLWRRRLTDLFHTAYWTIFPGRTWRAVVLGAVRVLERRGRQAGVPRRPDQTLAGWVAGLPADDRLTALVRLAERAAYAPALPPPADDGELFTTCRATLHRWPQAAFPTTGATKA